MKKGSMSDIVKIVQTFLTWVLKILNALGITAFDERLSEAIEELA